MTYKTLFSFLYFALIISFPGFAKVLPNKVTKPAISDIKQFNGVPFADSINMVIDVITLPIPEAENAYNASMIQADNGYLVAFRYDLPWDRIGIKKAKIGLLEVDRQFRPLGDVQYLNLDNQTEDPRLFSFDGTPYISYTHLTFWGPSYLCGIGLSQINPSTLQVEGNWDLLYKKGPREKNWAPFTYTNDRGEKEMYLVYSYNPFEVVRVAQPITGAIEHPIPIDASPKSKMAAWEKKWGAIRGGTPAILVDNEYVSFFHSAFREKSYFWYVFGAITFDSKPPFTLKRISQFPILFKDIFTTPPAKGRNQYLRATFPGGIVKDTQDGRDVFHVILGESDTSIKIVTIDKETLFSYMKSVR